jgi:hypothetical protein
MKIQMLKKSIIVLLSLMMVLGMTGIAGAVGAMVGYYEVGAEDYSSGNTGLTAYYVGGEKRIQFPISAAIRLTATGKAGDSLVDGWIYQALGGAYSLAGTATPGVYSLSLVSGTNTVKVSDDVIYPGSYFSALATALQIDFNTHTIAWSDLSSVSFNNALTPTSDTLTDLQARATEYQFTSFNFQTLTNESNWLAGTDKTTKNTPYYAKMEGFAPEPGEWALMLVGLGMLGFYLHRRGYLNFDLAPQAMT